MALPIIYGIGAVISLVNAVRSGQGGWYVATCYAAGGAIIACGQA